ncbi:saposin-C [Eurytemora carolleeae]|uniref:saposin-C n=1 Tax=Eurytemora carolleeae TaxID=1294199 RepID=UPI000C75BB75|nr:saposin-C [Eurytemora carolleeae]|eukprot:XP_023322330.1 saposin-C-like [Eurytemora affinis]
MKFGQMFNFLPFLFVLFVNTGVDGLIKDGERSDISCSLCMAVMQLLDETITDPTNEQQVINFLDQICGFLPVEIQAECHALIMEYVDDIIELLVNEYLAPADVCDAINLCP